MQLRKPRRSVFDKKLRKCISKSDSDKETIFFSKKVYFLEWSYGHVECGVDSPKNFFWQEAEKFAQFLIILKTLMNFFRKAFSFGLILWEHRKQLWQPRSNFSDRNPKISCPTSERDLKNTKLSRSYRIFPWTQKMLFWQHRQKDSKDLLKSFSAKCETDKTIYFFSKSFIVFKLFLWTRRMQPWKPRRSFVDKMLKKFSSEFQPDEQTSKSSFCSKGPMGTSNLASTTTPIL